MASFGKVADLIFEIMNGESMRLFAHFHSSNKQSFKALCYFASNILLLYFDSYEFDEPSPTFSPFNFSCTCSGQYYLMEPSSFPFSCSTLSPLVSLLFS